MQITKQYRKEKSNQTERGELLRYFLQTLNQSREKSGYKNLTFPRVAHLLQGQDVPTLYYMKSCMKDRDLEAACKFFYWSIRPETEKEPQ